MKRIKITIQYNGTNYGGWQCQTNAPSIQQALGEALWRLTGERVTIIGSGRTDAGVHACAQVAHFDTDSRIPPDKFALALNTWLDKDIRVLKSEAAPDAFHAQYGAVGKWYRYVINNGRVASAFRRDCELHVHAPLDAQSMHAAARFCEGKRDFSGLRASGSAVKSTVRKISYCGVARRGERIYIQVVGNGFLYHMVRIIAGTLIETGMRARPVESMREILQGRDRKLAGPTAPAHGLMLMGVAYSQHEYGALIQSARENSMIFI